MYVYHFNKLLCYIPMSDVRRGRRGLTPDRTSSSSSINGPVQLRACDLSADPNPMTNSIKAAAPNTLVIINLFHLPIRMLFSTQQMFADQTVKCPLETLLLSLVEQWKSAICCVV